MGHVPFNFQFRHMAINCDDKEQADSVAKEFCDLFGFSFSQGSKSNFSDPEIEIMFKRGRGYHGHIVVGVDDIEATEVYFRQQGHPFIIESALYDAAGKMICVYIDGDFGGFAVHLLKN